VLKKKLVSQKENNDKNKVKIKYFV